MYHLSRDPLKTAKSKIHPAITMITDMLAGKDFFNVEIANKDDPFMKKVISQTEFMAKQFEPFSWTNIKREQDLNFPISEQVGTFFGFIPAPADLKKTRAEMIATQVMAENLPQKPTTQEEHERQLLRRELERRIRINDHWEDFAREHLADDTLSQLDIEYAADRASGLPLDRSFRRMKIEDALRVYEAANNTERARLRPILSEKVDRNIDKIEALPGKQRERIAHKLLTLLGEEPAAPPPVAQ